MKRIRWTALFWAALWASWAQGEELAVWLEDNSGARIEIATLTVAQDGAYTLAMAEAPFTDHFLSMRPFKCLEGPDKHWCHVPYPYEIKRNIGSDLIDLEYDLLFIWKGATEYGINAWNGVYYVLEKRGDQMLGALHEIDLGTLAAPPAAGKLRPVSPDDLHEADADGHWLPKLVVSKRSGG